MVTYFSSMLFLHIRLIGNEEKKAQCRNVSCLVKEIFHIVQRTLFILLSSHTIHIYCYLFSSEALDDTFCLLGLIVQLSKGVKELLHLPLQSCVAEFCSRPGCFRLDDLCLDNLVPVPLLREVCFQPNDLFLQLLVSLL